MLGPLEVRTGPGPADGPADGAVVEVAGARLRALLILLALNPGRLVTSGQLIDGLWAEEIPAGAANALQALVSRLRRAVPEAAIESRPTGYQLRLDPRCTDVVRFEELAAAGRAQLDADPAAAAVTLREALVLWRGPALADVAETDFGRAAIARLDSSDSTAGLATGPETMSPRIASEISDTGSPSPRPAASPAWTRCGRTRRR